MTFLFPLQSFLSADILSRMSPAFDISGEPPTREEIARAREEARVQRAEIRRRNIRFLIVVLVLVATIMTTAIVGIIPLLDDPGAEPDIVGLFAYLTPYLFVALFMVGNTMHHDRIEKPRKALEAWMEGLVEAAPEQLAALDADALSPQAADYLRRLTAQGRAPLRGELAAMQEPPDALNPAR